MKWLGPILLVGVFVRHDTSSWLPGYTPAAWFYILGGVWEMILCTVLLLFLRTPLAVAALWIGVLEGAQISACRLLTKDYSAVPKWQNLCDHLTGLPVGAIMTGLYLYIVCQAIGKSWHGFFGSGHEVAFGITLTALMIIAGNEIAHLVSPWAALLVMAAACLAGVFAYERGS
jgi:hypothetical protein